MKKNYTKYFLFLPILPLLMANAPAPQVFQKEYKDYQLTFVSEERIETNTYAYYYNLKNTGTGYISYIYIHKDTDNEYFSAYRENKINGFIFEDTLYEPGFDQTITFVSNKKASDINKVKVNCQGYNMFDKDVAINGTKKIALLRSSGEYEYREYTYRIDLDLETNGSDYNYGAVLKLLYEGSTYYVKVDERNDFYFTAYEELDLEKLTLQDVTVIKSKPYYSDVFNAIGIVVFVIIFGFFLLLSFGIFAAIFFPAMARRRRRRRALQAAQK